MHPHTIPSRLSAPQRLAHLSAAAFALIMPLAHAQLVINEVDSDQTGTDANEFIELYDGGVGNTSLDGYVIVFFNGGATGDTSYAAYDLDGKTTNANGFFVLGNAAVVGAQMTFATGTLQNGTDAVALYQANGADFPNATPPTTTNLIDAIVYGSSNDAPLLTALGETTLYNENGNGLGATQSLSRVPDGSSIILAQLPTPGATNGGGGDVVSPTALLFSPAVGASQAYTDGNLAIKFDENIQVGATGTIVIKTSIGDTAVETITLPSSKVTATGASGIINPDVVLDPGISYYVEVTAGTFTDLSNNPAAAVTGSSAWSFTTRSTGPLLIINQYYEGAGSDRYIELKNLTNDTLLLDGYRVAAWSDTAPSDNEGWKSGVNTTTRVTNLTGKSIPPNGRFLIAEIDVDAPAYAVGNNDLLDDGGCTAIDGDDSVVLYTGSGFTTDVIVDAVSISASEGTNTSYYRLSEARGFGFNTGGSILNYGLVWGTKTPAQVASAAITEDWYLQAAFPPKTLSLGFLSSTLQENGVPTTATITRDGSTEAAAFVTVTASIEDVVLFNESVEIEIDEESADFVISAIDNPWLSGNQTVTLQVTCPGYTPGSAQITVQDDLDDAVLPVVINEVDSDQAVVNEVNDASEFIELYNTSNQAVSLDGVVLVLYNGGGTGTGEASYLTINLSGQQIAANGFFVVGNPGVTNVSAITFPNSNLQNGADAVALYVGNPASYPTGTLASAAPGYLVDAVVYGTDDAAATVLLNALTPGEPQVDEGSGTAAETEAIARVPDGGARFDSDLYVAQAPTPGATNVIAPPANTFANWIGGYDVDGQTAFSDDFDNDGLDNALENILGSNPAVANQWLSALSSSGGNLSFQHRLNPDPALDLSFVYQWSTDLVNWYGSTVANPGGTLVTIISVNPLDPPDQDLFFVTATVTGTPVSKVFVRIKVEQN